jgi:hypothetical protein
MISRTVRGRESLLRFGCALAILALPVSAGAQSIEDRAAEVVRSMEAPPPVETVIELRRGEVERPSITPNATPSRAPASAPTHQLPAMRTPPEFLKRLERIHGRPGGGDQKNPVVLGTRRPGQIAPGIPAVKSPTPGLVQTPSMGARVQGTANAYTGGKISGRP